MDCAVVNSSCTYSPAQPPDRALRLTLGLIDSDNDDLTSFEASLPAAFTTSFSAQALQKSPFALTYTYRYATAPIRCSSACRQINAALTGAKARAREGVDEKGLREAWEALEVCWEEFEELRCLGPAGIITNEDTDRFVSGWQIFLFECREYSLCSPPLCVSLMRDLFARQRHS